MRRQVARALTGTTLEGRYQRSQANGRFWFTKAAHRSMMAACRPPKNRCWTDCSSVTSGCRSPSPRSSRGTGGLRGRASRGLTPRARILPEHVRSATIDEADTLGLAPGAPLFELERLRLMDEVPILVDRTPLPPPPPPGPR